MDPICAAPSLLPKFLPLSRSPLLRKRPEQTTMGKKIMRRRPKRKPAPILPKVSDESSSLVQGKVESLQPQFWTILGQAPYLAG